MSPSELTKLLLTARLPNGELDVGYMAGIAVAWREQKDLMMAALQHHSVRIRDFSKHHGRDGKCGSPSTSSLSLGEHD